MQKVPQNPPAKPKGSAESWGGGWEPGPSLEDWPFSLPIMAIGEGL